MKKIKAYQHENKDTTTGMTFPMDGFLSFIKIKIQKYKSLSKLHIYQSGRKMNGIF